MYLGLLKEEHKGLFLGLAFNLALADGNYSDEEQAIIASYCEEMKIVFDKEKMVRPINEIISKINLACDMQEKKIIVFEAMGLAMCDYNYDEREREFIQLMADTFELGSEFLKKCECILNEYMSFQGEINKLIVG